MERGRSNSSCECVSSNPLDSCLVYTVPGGVLCQLIVGGLVCKSAVSFRSAVSRPDVEHNTSITVQSATYCHFFVVTLFMCYLCVCGGSSPQSDRD